MECIGVLRSDVQCSALLYFAVLCSVVHGCTVKSNVVESIVVL